MHVYNIVNRPIFHRQIATTEVSLALQSHDTFLTPVHNAFLISLINFILFYFLFTCNFYFSFLSHCSIYFTIFFLSILQYYSCCNIPNNTYTNPFVYSIYSIYMRVYVHFAMCFPVFNTLKLDYFVTYIINASQT